jgi:hypothetical protein
VSNPISIVIKSFNVYQGVSAFVLPGHLCQSRLGGRSGSNACTIIALLTAEQFLRGTFYSTPGKPDCMLPYIALMFKGNQLYDLITPDNEGQLFDGQEAIAASGMEDFLAIGKVLGNREGSWCCRYLRIYQHVR